MLLILLFTCCCIAISTREKALSFPLTRRAGRFVTHEPVNFTRLSEILDQIETRYLRTRREVDDNRLVRRWLQEKDDEYMLDDAGIEGQWYTTFSTGEPPQSLEVDIDMLSPDFYTIMTSSGKGSRYDTFISKSHKPGSRHVHDACTLSTDIFRLPHGSDLQTLDWPICQPSKSSRHTLFNSGTILGLAPNNKHQQSSLSRLSTPSLSNQLHEKGLVDSSIWSITLLDSTSGILTLGGTLAAQVEEIKIRNELELKYLDISADLSIPAQIEEEVKGKMAFSIPVDSSVEDHFRWTPVRGAEGLWMGLMGGIWVNGVKILKNQPFLLDLSCPFILAPPSAFAHFASSISGSKLLTSPSLQTQIDSDNVNINVKDRLFAFPCLNPPTIAFEIAGWNFPVFSPSQSSTRDDSLHGPNGGKFSLGKLLEETLVHSNGTREVKKNSGYCVSIVVESSIGGDGIGVGVEGFKERIDDEYDDDDDEARKDRDRRRREVIAEAGMKDYWVFGEPFFRGLGVVFDDGSSGDEKTEARMGFRVY